MTTARRPARALLLASLLVVACGPAPSPRVPDTRAPADSPAPPPAGPTAATTRPGPTASTGNSLPGVSAPPSSVSGSGPAATAIAVPAARAWGEVATTRLPVAIGGSRHFVAADAGTSDGAYLIGSVQRDGFPDAPGRPGYAALYEVATGRVLKMADLQTPDSQVWSASGDDEWVAWLEADDAAAYDWRLFSYSRRTGRVREVARASENGDKAVPGPMSLVWVGHGVVLWGQAVGTGVSQGDVSNTVVRRADLASGRVETLATSAGSPALSWPWVAWLSLPAGGSWRTVFRNLDTGWTDSMDQTPPVIALDGQSAAFGAADSHSIWLIDDVTRPSAVVQIARGADDTDYLEWPTLNSRIVAWAQNGDSIVYDRAERQLVVLPVGYDWASGWVAGPNLVWAEAGPTTLDTGHPDWFVVVDTTSMHNKPGEIPAVRDASSCSSSILRRARSDCNGIQAASRCEAPGDSVWAVGKGASVNVTRRQRARQHPVYF